MSGKLKLDGELCKTRLKMMEEYLGIMMDSLFMISDAGSQVEGYWEGEAAKIWCGEMDELVKEVREAAGQLRNLAADIEDRAIMLSAAQDRVDEILNGFEMWLV